MIHMPFGVETPRRECVWRINEEDSILVGPLLFNEHKSIPLNERQAIFLMIDFANPARKGFGIPPRHQSTSVFAGFN
jgi:hypothetical protein